MNKRLLSAILALILILSVGFAISGCNQDEDVGYTPSESTDVTPETEKSTDNETVTEADGTEAPTSDKEAESTKENKTEADKAETESPSKADGTTTEHTSGSNEPVTCDVCGYEIIKGNKGDIAVGNYCDGKCDEWYGELE